MNRINNLTDEDLQKKIDFKLNEMINDTGQSIDDKLLLHMIERLPSLLKYKFGHHSWLFISSAWDKGIFGEFGKVYKITVSNLIGWVFAYQKQQQQINRSKEDFNAELLKRNNDLFEKKLNASQDDLGSFIAWLTKNNIWIDDLAPGTPLITNNDMIPPEIHDMYKDWIRHYKNNTLDKYKLTLTL